MKRIIFIHSPIQKFLMESLLNEGVISDTDLLVYHRHQEPIRGNTNPHLLHKGYALNDPLFLVKLLHNHTDDLELLLPHSLCVAYHMAEALPQVRKISFLEEGTGTVYALRDPGFTTQVKSKQLKLSEIIGLLLTKPLKYIQTLNNVRLAIRKYNSMTTPFMRFSHSKPGHLYGLAYWRQDGIPYIPTTLSDIVKPLLGKKVLIAIGRAESKLDGYWPLIQNTTKSLSSIGIEVQFKLHPSLETPHDMSRISAALGAKDALTLYNPAGRELGIAIVNDGFLGAISCFSSFQIYAHLWSRQLNTSFPMLNLDNMLALGSLQEKTNLLPEIGLMDNLYLDYESWLAALNQKQQANTP